MKYIESRINIFAGSAVCRSLVRASIKPYPEFKLSDSLINHLSEDSNHSSTSIFVTTLFDLSNIFILSRRIKKRNHLHFSTSFDELFTSHLCRFPVLNLETGDKYCFSISTPDFYVSSPKFTRTKLYDQEQIKELIHHTYTNFKYRLEISCCNGHLIYPFEEDENAEEVPETQKIEFRNNKPYLYNIPFNVTHRTTTVRSQLLTPLTQTASSGSFVRLILKPHCYCIFGTSDDDDHISKRESFENDFNNLLYGENTRMSFCRA